MDTSNEIGSRQDTHNVRTSAVDMLLAFWRRTWNPPYDLSAIDELLVEDFILTNSGREVKPRAAFKEWVAQFQSKIQDLRLDEHDTFPSLDGKRVVSRWTVSGRNNGIVDTIPDLRPVSFTGISIWEVRDGKLAHNWVERSALELYQQLKTV